MKLEIRKLFEQLENAKKHKNQPEIERIRNLIYYKNNALVLKMAITDEDLKSECTLKFLDLICKYDLSKGIEFSTYAISSLKMYIKGAQRKLNNQTAIPRCKQHLINNAIRKLTIKLNREPKIDEIYEEIYATTHSKTSATKEEIMQILNAEKNILSLDYEDEETDITLQETISTEEDIEDTIEKKIRREKILKIMRECLTDNQYTTLINRYGIMDDEQKTFQEIAQTLGDSRQRIKQLEKRALEILRNNETIQEYNPKRKCR